MLEKFTKILIKKKYKEFF